MLSSSSFNIFSIQHEKKKITWIWQRKRTIERKQTKKKNKQKITIDFSASLFSDALFIRFFLRYFHLLKLIRKNDDFNVSKFILSSKKWKKKKEKNSVRLQIITIVYELFVCELCFQLFIIEKTKQICDDTITLIQTWATTWCCSLTEHTFFFTSSLRQFICSRLNHK